MYKLIIAALLVVSCSGCFSEPNKYQVIYDECMAEHENSPFLQLTCQTVVGIAYEHGVEVEL